MKKIAIITLSLSTLFLSISGSVSAALSPKIYQELATKNYQSVLNVLDHLEQERKKLATNAKSYSPNMSQAQALNQINTAALTVAKNKTLSANRIEDFLDLQSLKLREMKQESLSELYKQKLEKKLEKLLLEAKVVESKFPKAHSSNPDFSKDESLLFNMIQSIRQIDQEYSGRDRRRALRYMNRKKEELINTVGYERAQQIIKQAYDTPIEKQKPVSINELISKHPESKEAILEAEKQFKNILK